MLSIQKALGAELATLIYSAGCTDKAMNGA